jgi:DNA-binding transcriptional ArsR family regulator
VSHRPVRTPTPPPSPPADARKSLDHLEQVRILAHPLRLRLLELFAEAPRTTKQAADRLSLPPTRLYHHVAALERVGLVRVRETRRNRGTIEKHYEAVARSFEMDPTRFARGRGKAARAAAARLASEGMSAVALHVLERARDGLIASLDASAGADLAPEDARRPLAVGIGIVATPERLVEMRNELMAVIEGWQAKMKRKAKPEDDEAQETVRAWLTIVLAPEVGEKPGKKSGSGGRRPVGGT